MSLFKYKAADSAGASSEVMIEADSQQESMSKLRAKGLIPVKYLGVVETETQSFSGRFLKKKELDPVDFTNRLVPLLNAHIPLERALGIIAEGTDDIKGKTVVNDLRRGLHEGKKFSALIKSRQNIFPPMYSNMVEAGEETGSLTQVLKELQRFLNSAKEMKEYLLTSSIYPIFVLSVTSVVVVLLFTVFIPRFSKIFVETGKKLPLPTKMMLELSSLITNFWWLWIILIFGIFYLIFQIQKGGRAREIWDEYKLKIPLLGELFHLIEMSRFLRTLAVLIQHHVHLLDTVRISERVIQNSHILRTLSGVSAELRGGARLSAALSRSPYVPKTAIRMLSIGEETGNMGEMLEQVSEHYEEHIRNKIKKLLSLFEPVVILVLAFVVLGVVLSIFMALMKMNEI